MNTNFNGYKNYETWNVSLWILNDESFHDFAKTCKHALHPYVHFVMDLTDMECLKTPDGVSWKNQNLDIETLNKLIQSL